MSKSTETKETLIATYRQLGADMKSLRTKHLQDIEALIKEYKAAKAQLVQQRYDLLLKIRAPKEDPAETAAA